MIVNFFFQFYPVSGKCISILAFSVLFRQRLLPYIFPIDKRFSLRII